MAQDRSDVAGAPSMGGSGTRASAEQQEVLIAEHEATYGPLPKRILAELRSGVRQGGAVGAKAAGKMGEAAEALRLEVVETPLQGRRALVGHVLGMRLLIPAEGIHGPREAAALLYLFGDAIAIRPTGDWPMSAVPLYGLHIILPQVAVARWLYKAGRTAHANVDLADEARHVEDRLATWTVDDFGQADSRLQVFMAAELAGPVHLYQHLGLVRLAFALSGGPLVRLKSALPEPSAVSQRLWELLAKVLGPAGLTVDKPAGEHEEPPRT